MTLGQAPTATIDRQCTTTVMRFATYLTFGPATVVSYENIYFSKCSEQKCSFIFDLDLTIWDCTIEDINMINLYL